jgi:tetratricopeptide (TPR) repeat protein
MPQLLPLLAVILLTAGPVWAQATLGGTVSDSEGNPVHGVKVTVRPLLDDTLRFSVETGEDGRYTLENFNPSRGYRFQLFKEGYLGLWRDVEVGIDGTSRGSKFRQDFVLHRPEEGVPRESRLVMLSRHSPAAGAYQKAQRALDRGDLEKALKRFENARQLDPELAPVHEGLAVVYHRMGRHTEALATAERALEISPGDPDFLRIRYDALAALGEGERARATLLELAQIAASPSHSTLFYNEGVEAARGGDTVLAESMFQNALRLDPELRKAREALAKVYIQSSKLESAAAMAGELLADTPGDVDLLRIRQEAFARLGREEDARQALRELVAADPGPRTATLLYNQGVAAFNGKDDAKAEELFRLALEVDSDNESARLGLAEVYLRQRRFDECLATLEPILRDDPEHTHALRVQERAIARRDSGG